MKKKLIMLLAMLACMSASAQVKFGAKVGVDLTNFWGKECGHHMVLNYQAGLLMEYKFHPHFGISPEVVFAAQGGQERPMTEVKWVVSSGVINTITPTTSTCP